MMRRRGGPTSHNGWHSSPQPRGSPSSSGMHPKRQQQQNKTWITKWNFLSFGKSLLLVMTMFLGTVYVAYTRIFSNHTDVYSLRGVKSLFKEALAAYNDEYVVFLTLSNGMPGETHIAMGRSKRSPRKALSLAQQDLPHKTTGYPYVKVDVITGTLRLENFNYAEPIEAPGPWFGLALDWERRWIFLPEEVHAHAMVDQYGLLRWERLLSYARSKSLRGWPVPDLSDDENMLETPLDLFQTSSVFYNLGESSTEPIPVYHGHRMYDKITAPVLRSAITAATKYLADIVDSNGHILYHYKPRSHLEPREYSLSRHAGAIYAMARTYNIWKDSGLLEAMKRALTFLLKYAKICAVPSHQRKSFAKCIVEPPIDNANTTDQQQARLDTNAQALMALTEYMEATGDYEHLDVARGIASWIVPAQRPDGQFVQLAYLPDLKLDEELYVRFHDSKAIFALTRLYNVVKLQNNSPALNQEWIQVAARGADAMIMGDRRFNDTELVVDGWLLKSLGALHQQGHPMNALYTDHVSRSIHVLFNSQNDAVEDEEDQDFFGVFFGEPSSARTAILAEGLCSVHKLALDMGLTRNNETQMIMESVHDALRYQLQSQYTPENAMYMREPDHILGAFRDSPFTSELRLDYTQYNLCSMLCALEFAEKQEKQEQAKPGNAS